MQSPPCLGKMSGKASWTDERTRILLTCFCDELTRGKGTDAGGLGRLDPPPHQVQQDCKDLVFQDSSTGNNSGFGWDALNQLPTAPDEAYIAAHPKSAVYTYLPLSFPLYDESHVIFSGAVATGEFASAGIDSNGEDSGESEDDSNSNPDFTDDSDITTRSTNGVDNIQSPMKRPRYPTRRGNAVADGLVFLAQTQLEIQEKRLVQPPSTAERAITEFRNMQVPLNF
ncbi:hypothetical protein LEN26_002419 [Aphanomyces euteiches]|nr:hypothetical protein LEN26_002419 [Aphanomyces euteiches]